MTVKRRLVISNIIMIVVPVLITLLVGIACLAAVYSAARSSHGFGFDGTDNFYDICMSLSAGMYEIFEKNEENATDKLDAVCGVINKETMYVTASCESEEFYTNGNSLLFNKKLTEAAEGVDGNVFISGESGGLYRFTTETNGKSYELYIFSVPLKTNYTGVKRAIIVSAVLIAFAVLCSVFLTNRFLTRFAIRKIEQPLEMLALGVDEIKKGNLDYRIEYDSQDEFTPVCVAFNQMAQRLKASVELAQKNERNRKELLLDISHDLRSPLTSIQAYVEGILDGVASSEEMQRKYLETIKRKTTDIEKMVSSLFAYSKLDMEEMPVRCENMDAASFTRSVVKTVRDEFSQRGLNVIANADKAVYACADEEMLTRILSNLLDNSLKYKNKPVGTAKISVTEDDRRAVIVFEDDGPGVSEENLGKLFDIFYRTDKARSNTGSGSGIGLAFVKKAVEIMNGTVRAGTGKLGGLAIIIELERGKNGQNTDN